MFRSFASLSLTLSCALALAACGEDAAGTDAAPVDLFDAKPIDAGIPDAAVCAATMCGSLCVDTDVNPDHCGACDDPCGGAEECVGGMCECLSGFVPKLVAPGLDMLDADTLAPNMLALMGFAGGAGFNVLLVGYDPAASPLDTPIPLAGTPGEVPLAGVGYNVDINDFSVAVSYAAVSGTVTFQQVCDVGVRGVLTDVNLVEVLSFTNPVPVEGGCTEVVAQVEFGSGSECPAAPDAGVGSDAGAAVDAGVADGGQ